MAPALNPGMSSTIARRPAGTPVGGQLAPTGRSLPTPTLTADATPDGPPSIVDRDSVLTQRYDSRDEKLAALQEQLAAAVTDLRDDHEWNRHAANRKPARSPGPQLAAAQLKQRHQLRVVTGLPCWQTGHTPIPESEMTRGRRRIPHTIPERHDQQHRRRAKGAKGGHPPGFDAAAYAQRNTVERGFLRLKHWRGIATRYNKSHSRSSAASSPGSTSVVQVS